MCLIMFTGEASDGHYHYVYPYHEDEKCIWFIGNNDLGDYHTGQVV